jgi:hypothetical protein
LDRVGANSVTSRRVLRVLNGDFWLAEAKASDQSLWCFSGLPVTMAGQVLKKTHLGVELLTL